MQDRFRFRFWDEKAQKWFHFGFETFPTYEKQIWEALTDGKKIYQSTGIKDKNGKLIYEGDIIEIMHSMGKKAVVYWDNEKCCFKLKGKKIAYNALITIRNDYFEIIGNIYKNQELLKEG